MDKGWTARATYFRNLSGLCRALAAEYFIVSPVLLLIGRFEWVICLVIGLFLAVLSGIFYYVNRKYLDRAAAILSTYFIPEYKTRAMVDELRRNNHSCSEGQSGSVQSDTSDDMPEIVARFFRSAGQLGDVKKDTAL